APAGCLSRTTTISVVEPVRTPPTEAARTEPQPSSPAVPVDADDAVWGSATAPVTIVVFTDLECPFCAQNHATLVAMKRHYGEERLRVVVKHLPLAMHPQGPAAARVAQAVLASAGRQKAFAFLDLAYARPDAVSSGRLFDLVRELGLDPVSVLEHAEDSTTAEAVLADVELARRLEVTGVPHLRVNGLPFTGVQAEDTLRATIDAELRATAALSQSGVQSNEIYAVRVAANLARPTALRVP